MKKILSPSVRLRGFTLIELIIAIGFFGFMASLLMTHLVSVYHFREVIRFKKELNLEASSILNNGLAGLIRSGFAINYDQTKNLPPQQPSMGLKEEVDQLSIYTNRAETQYFTIYRKSYQLDGEMSDTAPLYLAFSNGEEFSLHSSEVVVEDFDIEIPSDPRLGGDREIQPYVRVSLTLRKRYPHGEVVDETQLSPHEIVRTSYTTTFTLRNSGPARDKNPLT